jgi:hypothetical protein
VIALPPTLVDGDACCRVRSTTAVLFSRLLLLQVVLWYASLYCVFLWIFGGASDIWRYGLNFQEPRPAGVFVLLPIIVFIMFLLW